MILDVSKIRELMLAKGITQADLARTMRVTRQAINIQLIRGRCNINRAHRYADILGVPVTYIVADNPPDEVQLTALLADFNAQTRDLIAKVNVLIERMNKNDVQIWYDE